MGKTILQEAQNIRYNDRQEHYGWAYKSYRDISKLVSVITDKNITPLDCAAVMLSAKLIRERHRHKRDNLVDACGYIDIINEIYEHEGE